MNTVYRIVWNTVTNSWVVASEFAKGRKKSGSRERVVAGAILLSGVLGGMSGTSYAGVVVNNNPQESTPSCDVISDNGSTTITVSTSSTNCIVPIGTSASGQGNPGNNAVFYSSSLAAGAENSLNLGGYLDAWKAATFHGGVDMQNTKITNLANGTAATDAATFGQLTNATRYFKASGANDGTDNAASNGAQTIAIGANAYSNDGGSYANTTPYNESIAVGNSATATGAGAVALGDHANANFTNIAVGYGADASGGGRNSMAIGQAAKVTGTNAIALGALSVADRDNTLSVGSATSQRQIVNVAAGTAATDAANVSQLTNATRYFKAGGLNDGTDNANMLGGLGIAIGANSKADNNASATGGPIAIGINSYAWSNYSGNDVTGHGVTDSIALGSNSHAGGAGATALGVGANANYTNIAIGPYADASGAGRNVVAIGQAAKVTGWAGVALGELSNAAGNSALALGASASASAANSVALGASSTTTADLTAAAYNPGSAALSGTASTANGEVSIGSATKERRLTNLAAGSAATDAVNVSQLQAEDATVDLLGANTAAALGGGATYNATTGALTAPSYALSNANSIAGTSGAATDVGTGFSKVDAALGALNTTANKGFNISADAGVTSQNIAPGGTVQYAAGTNATVTRSGSTITYGVANNPSFSGMVTANGGQTVGASQTVNMVANKVTNIADGTVAANSKDAVDGGQLYTTNQQVQQQGTTTASALGGGAGYNAGTGAISAPSYALGNANTIAGTSGAATDVGSGFSKVDAALGNLNTNITNTTTLASNTNRYFKASGLNNGTDDATSSGPQSIAIGAKSKGVVLADLAIGVGAVADSTTGLQNSLNSSMAIGYQAQATGGASMAIGINAIAAANGMAVGRFAQASGVYAAGLGSRSLAQADNSVALGARSFADRTNTVSVGASTSFTDAAGTIDGPQTRQVVNMAAGTQANDAVNVSQLTPLATALGAGFNSTTGAVTGPSYALTNANSIDGTTGAATDVGSAFGKVDAALGGLNTQVTQNTSDIAGNTSSINSLNTQVTQNTTDIAGNTSSITNLQNTVNNISSGTVGLVQQAAAGADLTVGKGTDGAAVDFADMNGNTRTLKNVTAGVADTDAVNMSQLNATNANVAQNTSDIAGNTSSISNLDNRVTQNTSDISTINNSISGVNGQLADAVMYDSAAHDTVTLGNAGTPVQLTNVKDGNVAAGSTDAVNGSQLYETNKQVAQNTSDIAGNTSSINSLNTQVTQNTNSIANNTSSINSLDTQVTQNASDIAGNTSSISNLDNRVTQNAGDISTINNTISGMNGQLADAVMYDSAAHDTVTLGNAGTPVQLTNVKDGNLAVGSTDAVNGSQLYATNQQVAQNTSDIAGNTSSINSLNTQVTQNTTDIAGNTSSITNLQTTVNNISSGTVGLVQQAAAGADLTVGKGTDGAAVDFADVNGNTRTLKNVTAGVADTDAVNMSQLNATNAAVAQNTTDIAGNTSSITNLQNTVNNISTGTVGLVQQAAAGADLTVGKGTDGAAVDFADVNGNTRTLKNVTAGVADTDAVNMSQLNATNANVAQNTSDIAGNTSSINSLNTQVTQNTTDIANNSMSITNLDARVTQNTSDIAGNTSSITNLQNTVNNISSGTVGLVQQATAGADLTVGKGTDGAAVDFADVNGNTRTLKNVTAGVADTDAVNMSQLNATNAAVAQNTTDIAGNTSSINTLNTQVTQNTTDIAGNTSSITNLQNTVNNISSGTVGLVQQAAAGADLTVGKDTDGAAVDFADKSGNSRTLKNVTAGVNDTDAVNMSQLNATNAAVAQNTSDIAGNTTSISNLDARVTTNEGDISTLNTNVNNIDARVTQNTTDIAGNTSSINQLDNRVTNNESNISNLQTTVNNISTGTVGLVQQANAGADLTVGKGTDGAAVDFADVNGNTRTLKNVTAGVSDTDAVNMSQLNATNAAVAQNTTDIAGNTSSINSLNTQVTQNTTDIAGNTSSITNLQTTVNNISNGTVGLVQQAAAGADLTVGKGTDGAAVDFADVNGNTRTLKNVTAGVNDTDAVNMSQLNATNANVAQNTSDIAGNTTSISNLDARVTTNEGDISTLNTNVSNIDARVTQNTTDIAGNTSSITNLQNTVNNISNGTVGLVQQAAAGADLTVGKGTDGAAVDFADVNGNTRTLKNVTAGVNDTDAVNMSQLNATNANVAQNTSDIANNTSSINSLNTQVTQNTSDIAGNTSSISNLDNRVTQNTTDIANNSTSITNLDARVTTNEGNISNLQTTVNNISSGTVGLVQQAAAGADLTVGKGTDGAAVDFADVNGNTRTLKSVTAGVNDTDAVNMSQLNATNANVAQNTSDIANNTSSINSLNTQVTQNTTDIANNTSSITNLDNRVTTNEGDISTLNTNVSNIDARVTQNTTDIANNATSISQITNQINSGTVGLVQQASAGADLTVGKDTDGAAVNFTGTAGARKLTGVAAGTVASGSQEAVNGSQLYATNQQVAQNTSDIAANTTSIGNIDARVTQNTSDIAGNTASISSLDARVTTNEGDISTLNTNVSNIDSRVTQNTSDISNINTTISNMGGQIANAVMYDSAAHDKITLGSAGTPVQVTNVKNGQLSANSSDAVNGSQLYATNQQVAQNTSDIAGNTAAINNINTQISNGTLGLVQQTSAGANLTVGKNTDGAAVDFAGTAGARKLVNVAYGAVAAGSKEAVNGGQLSGVSQSVANAMGGGATVNSDGTISAPTYEMHNADGTVSTVNNVGSAITNLDNRVTNIEGTVNNVSNITNGQSGMFQVSKDSSDKQPVASGSKSTAGGNGAVASGNGSVALGNQATASADNSVALGANSVADRANTVSVGSAGQERQVTNVAAGTADTDAVNVGQLKSAGVINGDGSTNKSVTYDHNSDGSTSVTMNAGGDPTIIHNVAAGQVSSDAATVGQVNDAMQQTANWAKNYTDQQVANVSREARAGSASAIAVASLPQAYQPGQNSVGVAFGTYQGQNAVSLGMSAISASGRYILKVNATGSQHSGAGAGIGAGMVW